MITPRDYQKEANNSIFDYFKNGGKGNPLVVAPTGAGKTAMISYFCQYVGEKWPNQKILIISHVKEILEQDYETIRKHIGSKNLGLYSAGLKSKKIRKITVAGIKSIYKKPDLFNKFNIILVDECHLIPHGKNGVYHQFFSNVKKPCIGYTATPYRLGKGYLHEGDGAFFDEIVYTIEIATLQKQGYLCELKTKGSKERFDTKGIKKQAGDFVVKQLSLEFDKKEITKRIVNNLIEYKYDRKKWLLFAIDIQHAEHICEELNLKGVKSAYVHSKMKVKRDRVIKDYKNDVYQCLVTVGMLTTGFDEPRVDLIGLLRPTASPSLHVQMIGRGLRPHPGKRNCIILDYAGNLLRNGPINNPKVKVIGKGGGDAIMKECKNCFEIVHASVRVCPECKTKFEFRHRLTAYSRGDTSKIIIEKNWYNVDDVKYFAHRGKGGRKMLKAVHACGFKRFSEYLCFDHPYRTFPRIKANNWWRERRSKNVLPRNTEQALYFSKYLRKPKKIFVAEGEKFPKIKEIKF